LITGIIALRNIAIEKFPEASYPRISVLTTWNASPENLELFVTSIIEEEMAQIKGVNNIRSVSMNNYSRIVVEFTPDTKMDYAYLRVNEVLYQVHDDLPEDCDYPQIIPYMPENMEEEECMSIGIYSNMLGKSEITRIIDNTLCPKIENISGVSGIELLGVEEREVKIRFKNKLIKRLGLSLIQDVLPLIRDYRELYSLGSISKNNETSVMLLKTNYSDIDDLNKLTITSSDRRTFRLGELASISWDVVQEKNHIFRLNGEQVINIKVYREPGTNEISLCKNVRRQLEETFSIPEFTDLHYTILSDNSLEIRDNINHILFRIIFVILIICLVLLLFFRRWGPTLIILATIFMEVLITLNVLYFTGQTLNYFSLSGLALSFGMLVDNAIVVYSNIHHYMERGSSYLRAVKRSFWEIRWAIIAATLTNICVFFPFIYLQEEIRILLIPFAVTVGVALLASIIVSFTFIPIALMYIKDKHEGNRITSFHRSIYSFYEKLLKFFLSHRAIPLMTAVVLFGLAVLVFVKDVDKGRFFDFDFPDNITIYITPPANVKFETLDDITKEFEHVISDAPKGKIEYYFSNVYQNFAYIRIYFPKDILKTAYPFILREKLIVQSKYYGGVNVYIWGLGPNFSGGGGGIYYENIQVAGYNYYRLNDLTNELTKILENNPRITNFKTNSYRGRQVKQIDIQLKKDHIARYGWKPGYIISQLYFFLNEYVAGSIITLEDEYDIRVLSDKKLNIHTLKNHILTIGDISIKLSELADIQLENGPYRIERENQEYLSQIEYEYRGPYRLHEKFRESIVKTTHLPDGYRFVEEDNQLTGYNKLIENTKQVVFILGLTIILVFIILAILFESYLQPFIIMLSIPLAFIGVSYTFALFDVTFNSSAFIGSLLLCGIVVNNSIILVNRINQLKTNSRTLNNAIIKAAKERARPILMTSLTTIFGLMPFILYTQESTGEVIWRTLAFSTIGGLITSTIFTLLFTPVFYNLVERIKSSTENRKNL